MTKIAEAQAQVAEWAESKGLKIFEENFPLVQFEKLKEEVDELGDDLWSGRYSGELADVLICTLLLAEATNTDLEALFKQKLEVIRSRTGKVVNQVFVKDD